MEQILGFKENTYRPNKFEAELIKSHPKESELAIDMAYLSGAIMTYLFLSPYQQHNHADAFRHCFWSSSIAKWTSTDWAKQWTTAHEMHLPQDNLTRHMDEYNNLQGIKLIEANPNFTTVELIDQCLKLIQEGKLSEIQNKKLIPTTLRGFNLPNIFRTIIDEFDEILAYLAKYYPEVAREKNGDDDTALHLCIMSDYEYGFNLLVDVVNVNEPGNSGISPLMKCARFSYGYKYAQKLLERGANPDYQDPYQGETALMDAAVYGNKEMIDLLLPVSDKKIESFNGFTAYDLAMNENHFEAAKLLL